MNYGDFMDGISIPQLEAAPMSTELPPRASHVLPTPPLLPGSISLELSPDTDCAAPFARRASAGFQWEGRIPSEPSEAATRARLAGAGAPPCYRRRVDLRVVTDCISLTTTASCTDAPHQTPLGDKSFVAFEVSALPPGSTRALPFGLQVPRSPGFGQFEIHVWREQR